jgi:hypothetical protein
MSNLKNLEVMEGAFIFFVMMTAVGSLLSGYVEKREQL